MQHDLPLKKIIILDLVDSCQNRLHHLFPFKRPFFGSIFHPSCRLFSSCTASGCNTDVRDSVFIWPWWHQCQTRLDHGDDSKKTCKDSCYVCTSRHKYNIFSDIFHTIFGNVQLVWIHENSISPTKLPRDPPTIRHLKIISRPSETTSTLMELVKVRWHILELIVSSPTLTNSLKALTNQETFHKGLAPGPVLWHHECVQS